MRVCNVFKVWEDDSEPEYIPTKYNITDLKENEEFEDFMCHINLADLIDFHCNVNKVEDYDEFIHELGDHCIELLIVRTKGRINLCADYEINFSQDGRGPRDFNVHIFSRKRALKNWGTFELSSDPRTVRKETEEKGLILLYKGRIPKKAKDIVPYMLKVLTICHYCIVMDDKNLTRKLIMY